MIAAIVDLLMSALCACLALGAAFVAVACTVAGLKHSGPDAMSAFVLASLFGLQAVLLAKGATLWPCSRRG